MWGLQGIQEGNEVNDLDKFCAEQCGVEYFTKERGHFSIKKASDREIVREHMHISTVEDWHQGQHEWTAVSAYQGPDDRQWILEGKGKTIPDAEKACIKAIKEAMNE